MTLHSTGVYAVTLSYQNISTKLQKQIPPTTNLLPLLLQLPETCGVTLRQLTENNSTSKN